MMRKNFGANPITYPQPVLMIGTYNPDGTANLMNAAWGGISGEAELTICVSPSHRTADNLLEKKEFTVSMGTADTVVACDYVGLVSGKKAADKTARAGFHPVKAETVDAPVFEELPLSLECRVASYDTATGRLVGEIVNVSADESILGQDGKIDPEKLRPITFDPVHHVYLTLGEKVGTAFHDGAALNR